MTYWQGKIVGFLVKVEFGPESGMREATCLWPSPSINTKVGARVQVTQADGEHGYVRLAAVECIAPAIDEDADLRTCDGPLEV